MDNTAKAFAQKVTSELEKIVHALSVGPPWKHDTATTDPDNQSNEKPKDAVGHPLVIPPSPKHKQETASADKKPFPWWRIIEAIGIAAAVVVAVVNGLQWRDANRNFRVDERPWLKVELVPDSETGNQKVSTIITIGLPLVIPIRLKNIGKTIAEDVHSAFTIQIAGPNDKLFLPPDMTNPPHVEHPTHWAGITKADSGSIFPDQFHDLPISEVGGCKEGDCGPIPLSKTEFDLVASGASLIYLAGTVTYTDGFGLSHWTRFCTTLPNTHNGQAVCVEYNRADSNY